MKPYAEKLYQNKILFTWTYPANIVIYKEGKRLTARNPAEAVKLLEKLGLDQGEIETQPMEGTSAEGPGEETATHQEKQQRTLS